MGGLHVHFDAVGGVAGDMIVAALLDARPDLRDRVWADLAAVLPPEAGAPRLLNGAAAGLRAVRFVLGGKPPKHDETAPDQLGPTRRLSREHDKAAIEGHSGPRRSRHAGSAGDYRDMCARITGARLAKGAAERALAILSLVAGVEAELHGVPIEEVHFHEIADWDSLADVVAIGSIAAALEHATYSVSDLPRGGGLVKTRHGLLPVPAPATVALLKGFVWRDDRIPGERVTPTGAAALAHLVGPSQAAVPRGRLMAVGVGAGVREIERLPNVLRVLVLDRQSSLDASPREVAVISFDVDDMTGEEIAVSAERLRAAPGALDLTVGMRLGKKGRPVHDFRLLARTDAVEGVVARCLTETSTLGLRWRVERREVLPRDEGVAPTPAGDVRVKRAIRPDGETSSKAEDDDVRGDNFIARRRLRRLVESRSNQTEPHSR
ncbi:MAG: LarC family nickel insertion protein [Hyphomicrobiales bacterium]|nr:LarC family nickel insertion protein [Hyphomicrobiales bacterium]